MSTQLTNNEHTKIDEIKDIIDKYLNISNQNETIEYILYNIQGIIYHHGIRINRNLRKFKLIGDEFLNKYNKVVNNAKWFKFDSFKTIKINDYEIILINKHITIKINDYYGLIFNTCLNLAKTTDISYYYLIIVKNLIEKEYLNKIDVVNVYLSNDPKLFNKVYGYHKYENYLTFIKLNIKRPFRLIESKRFKQFYKLKCDVLTAFYPEMSGKKLNEIKLNILEITKFKSFLNSNVNRIIYFELNDSNELIIRSYMSYPYKKHKIINFDI